MKNHRNEDQFSQCFDRRAFLITVGSLVSAGALGLEGCGGGGGTRTTGGSSTAGLTPVPLTLSAARGTLVLPSGSSVKIVQVMNLAGQSVPATDNTFAFAAAAEAPVLTMASGPKGGVVLYGLLNQGNVQLSVLSTAIVLGYTALGVGAHIAEAQSIYLAAITNAVSLQALESAVAAAIVTRGESWLSENDTGLAVALNALQNELAPPASATKSVPHFTTDKPTRGVILDKTGFVSGLQINADGAGSMMITNAFRRRSYVYVDRVSYKVKGTGASVDFKGPILPQPIKMAAVKGTSNFLVTLGSAAGTLYNGSFYSEFYAPVVSGSIAIPVNPADAASTTYTATAVGIGVSPGDFGRLSKTQQDGWWEVTVESILIDIVAPIIAGIVIPTFNKEINNFAEFIGTGGVIKDIVNAVAASPGIRAKAEAGKSSEAALDVLLLIVKTDTLKNVFLKAIFDIISSTVTPLDPRLTVAGVGTLTPTNRSKFLSESGVKLLGYISKINLALQVFDTVTTALQLSTCNNADIFTLEVTNAIAKLTPPTAAADNVTIVPITFTASLTNADLATDSIVTYQWSCPCKFGDITDGMKTNHTDGLSFASSKDNIRYISNGKGKTGDTDTITVQIFKGGINNRVALAQASSTVTVKEGLLGSIQYLTIDCYEDADLTMPMQWTGAFISFPKGAQEYVIGLSGLDYTSFDDRLKDLYPDGYTDFPGLPGSGFSSFGLPSMLRRKHIPDQGGNWLVLVEGDQYAIPNTNTAFDPIEYLGELRSRYAALTVTVTVNS